MLIHKELFNQLLNLAVEGIEYQNERWITVKPHGDDSKGVHLKVEDGESNKQAIDRKFEEKEKSKNDNANIDNGKVIFTDKKGRLQSFIKEKGKWYGAFTGKEVKKDNEIKVLEDKLLEDTNKEKKEKDKFIKDVLDYGQAKSAGQYTLNERKWLDELVEKNVMSKKRLQETDSYGSPIWLYKAK